MERVKKVGIIGAGHIGSTLAFILSATTPYEIVLQDKDKDRAIGLFCTRKSYSRNSVSHYE